MAAAAAIPVVAYICLAFVQGLFVPGLQYDEAIFAHGAVFLLNGDRGEPPFAHAPGSWIWIAGRPFQLMVMDYAGAAKTYLLLPMFAMFGVSIGTLRIASLMLASAGIAAVAVLARHLFGTSRGLVAGVLLAVHPGFIGWSAFDNTGFALWMFALGAAMLALLWFVESPSLLSSFAFGVSLGFAVWCRANFVWLAAGAVIAALFTARRQLLDRGRWIPSLTAGAILGAWPLLLFEIGSSMGTLRFMSRMSTAESPLQQIGMRLRLLAATLFYDGDRRSIWHPAPSPDLETAAVVVVVLALTVIALRRDGWPRAFAITLISAVALTLTTRLSLRPYHFITYLPLVSLMAVSAVPRTVGRWRFAAAGALVLFLTVAVTWNVRAGQGMRRTGGHAFWSNATNLIADLATVLPEGRLVIADWGFGNSLYVLTSGRVELEEAFWGKRSDDYWVERVRDGGVFLTTAKPLHTRFDAPRQLEKALRETGVSHHVVQFRSGNGSPVAELIRVAKQSSSDD